MTQTPAQKAAATRKARARLKTDEQREFFDELRKLAPRGKRVYTQLNSVSASGMSRVIDLRVICDDRIVSLTYHAVNAFPDLFKLNRRSSAYGIVAQGCGMDMGFDLVYRLGVMLYDDGYALDHRWL